MPPQAATISSDSCSNNHSFSAGPGGAPVIRDITPVCYIGSKPCNPPNTTISTSLGAAVEEQTFTFTIYLGGALANCCWYKISWQQSARNSAITTGSPGDLIIASWLNRCQTPCDNSPEFSKEPVVIKCTGQDVIFNHGVKDVDRDSLSYAMSPPLGFSYSSPYSYTYPLTCLGGNITPNPSIPTGFYLSPTNGDLIFRPMQIQTTVLKIEVTEWRKVNGIYSVIGKTSRDMQFVIIGSCTNKLPTLSGPYSYEVCANQKVCFTINSNDQDPTDTTRMVWNNGIPAGTWTTNNDSVLHASGTFCWTPTNSDVSSLPYFFTASAIDNHCSLNGQVTRAYSILVSKPSASTITTSACKSYTVYGTTYKTSGTYRVAVNNGCIDTLTLNLTINTVNDSVIQTGDTLTAFASGARYQWVKCFPYTILPGDTNQRFIPSSTGNYALIINQNGCKDTSACFTVTHAGVGIAEKIFSSQIQISPNPHHGVFNIIIEKPAGNIKIEIYNSVGELVYSNPKATERNNIDLTHLANGTYFVKVYDDKNSSVEKIIKD